MKKLLLTLVTITFISCSSSNNQGWPFIEPSPIMLELPDRKWENIDVTPISVQINYIDDNNLPIFYIDNNLVKIDSLESILIYQLNTNEKYDKSIEIYADKEIHIEYLVKVMEIGYRNKFKIVLNTNPKNLIK